MADERAERSVVLKNILPGIVTTVMVLIVTWVIDSQERVRYLGESNLSASAFGNVIHSLLINEVNTRVLTAQNLGTLWRAHDNNLDTARFTHYARVLRDRDQEAIRSIQLAPDGVITFVYPLEGNEKLLGLDILKHHKEGEVTQRKVVSENLTVDGPVNLIQGGLGLVVRQPLFVNNDGQYSFWGFGTIVINLPPILAKVNNRLSGSG